jgi:uncharacterized protein (DUF2235 family)
MPGKQGGGLMKRIVICCDGTWNTPDQDSDGVPLPTNVARVAAGIAGTGTQGERQLTYYGVGVGTSGSKIKRMFAGATGWGLSENLLDAYRYLVAQYEPGDELFLFGFSRGAFTVRSLGGLINNSGILRPENAARIDDAYDLYRSRGEAAHPRRAESTLFRKTWAWQDRTPIRFIGVWDTVGALGNPLLLMKSPLSRRYKFHDTSLSSTVENAFHAVAVDEKRLHFKTTLWNRQAESVNQTLEQRWFVGVHSDVGGGTPVTGLSDLALRWLARKARDCGLALELDGLEPDPAAGPGKSRKGMYRLIPAHHRPIDASENDTGETLDDSVGTRYEDPNYRPPNLVDYFERRE